MDTTTNYNLKKPATTEYYTVKDQNDNMDIIDTVLKENADADAALKTEIVEARTSPGAVFPKLKYRFEKIEMDAAAHLTEIEQLQNEVLNSATIGTIALNDVAPVTSIDARINSGLNFEMTAKPLVVNLFGNDGDCEDYTKFSGGTLENDATNKVFGTKSIKFSSVIMANTITLIPTLCSSLVNSVANKYLLFSAYVKNNNAAVLNLRFASNVGTVNSVDITQGTKFIRVGVKIPASAITSITTCGFNTTSPVTGAVREFHFDGLSINEITADDYNNLSVDQLLAKYPYVNGIQPMMGLNIKTCGKNLFDFNKTPIVLSGTTVSKIDNGIKVKATNSGTWLYAGFRLSVKPNTNYKLSYIAEVLAGGATYTAYDSQGQLSVSNGNITTRNDTWIDIYLCCTLGVSVVGEVNYTNIQIEEGTVATAYEPYQDSELLIDGEFAGIDTYLDKVTYKNGVAKVLRKIKRIMLDGNFGTFTFMADYSGYKRIACSYANDAVYSSVTQKGGKYNGNILEFYGGNPTKADQFLIYNDGKIYISIADTESGWGETYTPTADEIKACMNGYKMNNGTFGTPYNGTGTKTWTAWYATDNYLAPTVCPTTKATGWTAWATLWYALTTPQEELLNTPIDGLSVYKGKTTIAMQTGIVKEVAKVTLHTDSLYYINNNYIPASKLEKSIKKFIRILKNGVEDIQNWSVLTLEAAAYNSYGTQYATIPAANYDHRATYEVIYEIPHEQYDNQLVTLTAEYTANLLDSHNELVKTVSNISAELGDLWTSLLPLADKELAMSAVSLLTTETTADLKAKVNQILTIWR